MTVRHALTALMAIAATWLTLFGAALALRWLRIRGYFTAIWTS